MTPDDSGLSCGRRPLARQRTRVRWELLLLAVCGLVFVEAAVLAAVGVPGMLGLAAVAMVVVAVRLGMLLERSGHSW